MYSNKYILFKKIVLFTYFYDLVIDETIHFERYKTSLVFSFILYRKGDL